MINYISIKFKNHNSRNRWKIIPPIDFGLIFSTNSDIIIKKWKIKMCLSETT